ncbi:hypothetical protein M758_UG031800, partial [Ceratodon purpureus]
MCTCNSNLQTYINFELAAPLQHHKLLGRSSRQTSQIHSTQTQPRVGQEHYVLYAANDVSAALFSFCAPPQPSRSLQPTVNLGTKVVLPPSAQPSSQPSRSAVRLPVQTPQLRRQWSSVNVHLLTRTALRLSRCNLCRCPREWAPAMSDYFAGEGEV